MTIASPLLYRACPTSRIGLLAGMQVVPLKESRAIWPFSPPSHTAKLQG